ncbi:conserved Plasmodium protein, unknown function [Plasmodium ovale curtisi]|uniref:Uncharacterized protein n=1 Tax=Plasmodium ovale curtisi TaxID=864141 RepID=A0A1A8VNI6_PLAOA|nr:conserved Plasmodium protein, unknown function [Plasmodium ovale curtisi]SBS99955.1 conserved Plasmodium protein, unknown function [Plasmodium ovale curtisi]
MAPLKLAVSASYLLTFLSVSCNLTIHPSLVDLFVESFRDHLFVSPNHVMSKRLAKPKCTSCDDFDCHHINTGKGRYIHENDTTEKVKKREMYDEREEGKYSYLHTTPFYTTAKDNEQETPLKGEYMENEEKLEKGENDEGNFFHRFFSLLSQKFSLLFSKKERKRVSSSTEIYPSYTIDSERTSILGDPTEQPRRSNNKYKVKGIYLGEHIDDLKSYSFLSPLSLAIDEINFNKILYHAWENAYSSYTFLKKSEVFPSGSSGESSRESSGESSGKSGGVREERMEFSAYKGSVSHMEGTTSHTGGVMKKNTPHRINGERNVSEKMMDQNESVEYLSLFKNLGKEKKMDSASREILKMLNITEERNFDDIFTNNKKVKVGICTKEERRNKIKKRKPYFLQIIKWNISNETTLTKILLRKKWEKKKGILYDKHTFSCVFYQSIENSKLLFYLNTKEEKISLSQVEVTDEVLYEEWQKENMLNVNNVSTLGESKLYMLSTNMLRNLRKYKNNSYEKNIYKLHKDYTGISKHVIPMHTYQKQMFLNFIFIIDICYNSDYINKHIKFKHLNTGIDANFTLVGTWIYGFPTKTTFAKNTKKESQYSGITSINPFYREYQSNIDNDLHVYNELYSWDRTKSIGDVNRINEISRHISRRYHVTDNSSISNIFSSPLSERGRIYLHEQVLNMKVDPAERIKRMKLLNFGGKKNEEKMEHSYLMSNLLKQKNNNDVLLLSRKGIIKFIYPLVLSELYIRFQSNPLYHFVCKKSNSFFGSNGNIISNEKRHVHGQVINYMNRLRCTYNKANYVYIFFNFFLNNNKKYGIKLEVHVDHFKQFSRYRDVPFEHINVMNYLKSNINQFRINKIEIIYSFSPFQLSNETLDHTALPFYVAINSLILNKSEKVYNYIPIFYTTNLNFLHLLGRNAQGSDDKNGRSGTTQSEVEEVKVEAGAKVEVEAGAKVEVEAGAEVEVKAGAKVKVEDEEEPAEENARQEEGEWTRDWENDEIIDGEKINLYEDIHEENTEEEDSHNYVNSNHFSIFTSLGEDIFLKHLTRYRCTMRSCEYEEDGHWWDRHNFVLFNSGETKNGGIFSPRRNIQINPYIQEKTRERSQIESIELYGDYMHVLKSRMLKNDTNGNHHLVAYNMDDLYNFEFAEKKYVIPPYNRGILINFEKETEQLFCDLYNNFFYIKRELNEHAYSDTRKVFKTIYIYSALLPTESDIFNFNYLTKNKLTLKYIQNENAKTVFKNIIPQTTYEEFYYMHKPLHKKVIDINIFDMNGNVYSTEFVGLSPEDGLYKTKIIEFIQRKLKNALQLNTEERK